MREYHKIQSVFKRDPATKHKTFLPEYSMPEFEYLKDCEWEFTEKVDGTNIRVMWDGENITYGGRTERANIPAHLMNALLGMFTPDGMRECFDHGDVCLFGEGYGPKIQKGGGNYRSEPSFVLFDVLCGDWWLKRDDVDGIAAQLVIESVPVIGTGTLGTMEDFCRGELGSEWGDFQAEGIVARPAVELKTRSGQRIITKLKCKDFRDE